jgi:hypothetical protein
MKTIVRWLGVTFGVASIGAMAALLAACGKNEDNADSPDCEATGKGGSVCIRVTHTDQLVRQIEVSYQGAVPNVDLKGNFIVQGPCTLCTQCKAGAPFCRMSGVGAFGDGTWLTVLYESQPVDLGKELCAQFSADLAPGDGACVTLAP